jgi:ribonuclease HI
MGFYAVAKGKTVGIFSTWAECSDSVKGYSGAIYKKFERKSDAESFIENQQIETIETPENIVTKEPDYYVYTDGACSNNGKPNALAGIGIYFGENDTRNVSERVDGKQTNNVAELTAILRTYSIIESDISLGKYIAIVTDSEYAVKCVCSYGDKCEKEGWKKEIPNKELVQNVYNLYKDKRDLIQFIHVKAHTRETDIHSIGNDHADRLANAAIGLETCPYAS